VTTARRRSVIVVGAGTSGSVLAARLSEDPALSVILLEAGPTDDYGDEILNPQRAQEVWETGANATSVMMGSATGPIPMVLGSITGGTSAINYMATVRGQPDDYTAWELAGLPGWGWDDVVRFFIAAERDLDFGPSQIHGDSGPLPVSRWRQAEHARCHSAFAEGMRQVGVAATTDVNDPNQLPGIGVFPATIDEARRRVTTSTAYLTESVRARANLDVRPMTAVRTIEVDRGRAIGVILEGGAQLSADEIIVAAGAIRSPALLLRSGIGPVDELRRLGIEGHADLPVGSTMSDHLGPVLTYHHDGPLGGTGGPAQAVLLGASDTKNVDYHVFPVPLRQVLDRPSFLLLTFLLRSSGRGSVTLGDDPYAAPKVTAPPLPDDAEARLGHAFRQIAAWERSSAATEFGCRRDQADDLTAPTAVAEALAKWTMSYGHMVGTCPMGSVLDADCRVRGIDGLRVVDASVMPIIPAGNTYLGCVMVAERIAESMVGIDKQPS
jgi:choline dehydrogenase